MELFKKLKSLLVIKSPQYILSKYRGIFFVLIFGIIGGIVAILITKAATPTVSLEPESTNVISPASSINDSTASGGQALQFKSGTTTDPWPGPNNFSVCGNSSILDGPSTAPFGAVIISPVTNLASAVASAPSGTTFYLTTGTHTLPTGPVVVKTSDKFIGAPGAVIDGQFQANIGSQSIAFKGGSSGVTIQYLTISNFGQADGKMVSMVNQTAINYSQGANWTISNNTISHNGGSGVWVTNSSKLQNNCIEQNEQTGVAVPSTGSSIQIHGAVIENNDIRNNNPSSSIESLGVCTGCAGGVKIWNSKGTIVRDNNVSGNNGAGIWVDNNNIDTLVESNVVKDNLKNGIYIEISYSAIIQKNYVSGNYVSLGPTQGNFPDSGIYIAESGGDDATKTFLGGTFPAVLDINNNYILDNWNGINLWEDAGRYCTQNDTVNCPPIVTDKTGQCITNLTANADICRWKSQNVSVHNNRFEMTSIARTSWCPTSNINCGKNAIVSNIGPSGTPYSGITIQTNISKNQNNKFNNNNYLGIWNFSVPNSGSNINKDIWQSTWGQDSLSQFTN